jgi:hypothetical protein
MQDRMHDEESVRVRVFRLATYASVSANIGMWAMMNTVSPTDSDSERSNGSTRHS